ncbi:FkbM family methyltransferase [Butyrivibrio sp. VCD2006]|uniref:FkbM family methyltransferase n=1 Tax=Butyrivibrio sp. VCD2006 TaxID=1280664 RepID=UPI00041D5E99|nr:FkbM family methyltransferase [Butyrivibrio sp. VCD2006]
MFDRKLFEKEKEIQSILEDEVSKNIFKYRLYANLANDVRYIHRMLADLDLFPFDEAYKMYEEVEKTYAIYPKMDVLSFVQTRNRHLPIALFGAGQSAELYYSLLEAAGYMPVLVLDNGINNYSFHDIEIKKPEKCDGLKNYTIIITSPRYTREMYWELRARGVPNDQIFIPDVNGLWIFNPRDYFDDSIWTGRENEIFVDAGAYNLQTAIEFAKFAKSYEKIYAFEPDIDNYSLCQKKQMQVKLNDLEIINAGLWDKEEVLRFKRGGDNGTATMVTDSGDMELKVVSLDEYLNGKPCTFIKMDIEGSELKALMGAKDTIKRYKPRLAICLYHKPMDLIDIPLYIKDIVPEYKLKIRHYSTWFFDTVLYAYID